MMLKVWVGLGVGVSVVVLFVLVLVPPLLSVLLLGFRRWFRSSRADPGCESPQIGNHSPRYQR